MEEQSKLIKAKWMEFGRVILFWIVLLVTGMYLLGFFDAKKIIVKTDAENTTFSKGVPMFSSKHYDISGGDLRTEEEAHSGKFSMQLDKENAFGFGFTIPRLKGNEKLEMSVWRKAIKGNKEDGKLIAQVMGGIWEGCSEVKEQKDGWEKIACTIDPPFSNKGKTLKIYCWNSGINPIYFDDLEVIINRE